MGIHRRHLLEIGELTVLTGFLSVGSFGDDLSELDRRLQTAYLHAASTDNLETLSSACGMLADLTGMRRGANPQQSRALNVLEGRARLLAGDAAQGIGRTSMAANYFAAGVLTAPHDRTTVAMAARLRSLLAFHQGEPLRAVQIAVHGLIGAPDPQRAALLGEMARGVAHLHGGVNPSDARSFIDRMMNATDDLSAEERQAPMGQNPYGRCLTETHYYASITHAALGDAPSAQYHMQEIYKNGTPVEIYLTAIYLELAAGTGRKGDFDQAAAWTLLALQKTNSLTANTKKRLRTTRELLAPHQKSQPIRSIVVKIDSTLTGAGTDV